MPEEVLPRLAGRGIDVQALGRSAVEAGFAPRELFCLEENQRTVRVWLE